MKTRKARKSSPISRDNELSIQLAQLRSFTSVYGALHEAQVLQLKLWPRVAIPNSKSSEAHVNCETSFVKIIAKTVGKSDKKQPERTEALARSIQWMLGDQWYVMIFDGPKKLYDLKPKVASTAKKYAGTDFEAGKIVPETPWNFKRGPSA